MSTLNVFLLVYFIQRDVLPEPVLLFWKLTLLDFISVLNGAITRVLGSKSTKAKPGDLVHTFSGWIEISIVPEAGVDVIQLPHGVKPTDILMAALSMSSGDLRIFSYIIGCDILDGPGPTAYIEEISWLSLRP